MTWMMGQKVPLARLLITQDWHTSRLWCHWKGPQQNGQRDRTRSLQVPPKVNYSVLVHFATQYPNSCLLQSSLECSMCSDYPQFFNFKISSIQALKYFNLKRFMTTNFEFIMLKAEENDTKIIRHTVKAYSLYPKLHRINWQRNYNLMLLSLLPFLQWSCFPELYHYIK